MKPLPRLLAFSTLALVSAAIPGGCAGHERYSYLSTIDMPQSITLYDTRTGESIWSQEIPVGRQLNVTFMRTANQAESQGWDEMRWSLTDVGHRLAGGSSTIRVPPPSERRLEVALRATPEARPQYASPYGDGPSTPSTAAAMPEAGPKARPAPEGIVLPDPKQSSPR